MANEEPLTFDQTISRTFAATAQSVLAACPELRSVTICLDYRGRLNDAGVARVVWVGPGLDHNITVNLNAIGDNQVTSPDAVIGSMQVLLLALRATITRAEELESALLGRLTATTTALIEKMKQYADQNPQTPTTADSPHT